MLHLESSLLAAKIKKPQFPAETVALIKSWAKQRIAESAAAEGRYLNRNVLVERRDDLSRRYKFILADKEQPGWTADNEESLREAKAEYEEAVNDLAEFDAAAKPKLITSRPPRPQRPRHSIRFVPDAEEWIRSLNPNQFFKHIDTPLPPPKKGESLADVHSRLWDDADALMGKMAEAEGAPLPVADALARFRGEVEKLAKKGRPRVSELFRAFPHNNGARFAQNGRVYWPETPVLHVGMENEVAVPDGLAFVAAMLTENLLEYGEALIRAQAKQFRLAPVPLADRAGMIAALSDELLGLHRQIERVESEMRTRKIEFDPFPLHVLARLRVAPDPERKLPQQQGPGSLVQVHADKKFIPARS